MLFMSLHESEEALLLILIVGKLSINEGCSDCDFWRKGLCLFIFLSFTVPNIVGTQKICNKMIEIMTVTLPWVSKIQSMHIINGSRQPRWLSENYLLWNFSCVVLVSTSCFNLGSHRVLKFWWSLQKYIKNIFCQRN